MILEHYSDQVITSVEDRAQEAPPGNGVGKPRGLWVSVKGQDDWPSWCGSEEFGIDRLRHRHVVELAEQANILNITDGREIEQFHREYRWDWRFGDNFQWTRHLIDWPRVAVKFDGVIIAPYLWAYRLPMEMGSIREEVSNWYYPWDCASGCIWNARAVAAIHLQEMVE